MTEFETLRPDMDAQVDTRLGDSLSYSIDGGDTWMPMTGFLMPEGETPGVPSWKQTWSLKLTKSALSGSPKRDDLIKSAKTGGDAFLYSPVIKEIDSDGGYWLIPLQKAA